MALKSGSLSACRVMKRMFIWPSVTGTKKLLSSAVSCPTSPAMSNAYRTRLPSMRTSKSRWFGFRFRISANRSSTWYTPDGSPSKRYSVWPRRAVIGARDRVARAGLVAAIDVAPGSRGVRLVGRPGVAVPVDVAANGRDVDALPVGRDDEVAGHPQCRLPAAVRLDEQRRVVDAGCEPG